MEFEYHRCRLSPVPATVTDRERSGHKTRYLMGVTINSYKKDKYYPRVARAVAQDTRARSDIVAPVDGAHRNGEPKPEEPRSLAGRPGSLSRARLRGQPFQGQSDPQDHRLSCSRSEYGSEPATYRANSGRHAALRFSKSGAKAIEDAYSRHYKWNQSAEKKRQGHQER